MFRGFSPGTQNADFFRGSYISHAGGSGLDPASIRHFACKSGLVYHAMPSCSRGTPGGARMAFQVDRSPFDPESGFEYYICFKPQIEVEGDEVESRISVEAALSVSETGDVAD